LRPFVELTGVSHTYATGGTLAVDGLDIRVNEGEFAAVVGPSGCGKSTLMKLATGLQFPQAGAVVVDGKEVRDPVKIAGMAFQNAHPAALAHHARQPHAAARDRRAAQVAAPPSPERICRQGRARQLAGLGRPRPASAPNSPGSSPAACSSAPRSAGPSSTSPEAAHARRALRRARRLHARGAVVRHPRPAWRAWPEVFTIILVTHDLREAVFLADRIFCMSARPGKIIAEREVGLARPRDLEITYTPEFSDIVHDLRARIGEARSAA
jgi:NitT/TauT family transport system ATP-binding protein